MDTGAFVFGRFDSDTCKILEISVYFLQKYFGHSQRLSQELVTRFLEEFDKRFNEDAIHHESSYRVAAFVHYLVFLRENPDSLGNWMIAEGLNETPADAFQYFRDHYFSHPGKS